jgi:hypothetical protein
LQIMGLQLQSVALCSSITDYLKLGTRTNTG